MSKYNSENNDSDYDNDNYSDYDENNDDDIVSDFDEEYENENEDEDEDLHAIEEFNKSLMKYKDFYKENVETIKLKFLYVNKDNQLENIKNDDCILNLPNILSCEELIKILKTNNRVMNKNYKIMSMCLYNVSIDPENIEYIKDEDFLTHIHHINDINIQPTINILQDLNEMLFIFKEKDKHNNNNIKSKKIHIKTHNKKTRKRVL